MVGVSGGANKRDAGGATEPGFSKIDTDLLIEDFQDEVNPFYVRLKHDSKRAAQLSDPHEQIRAEHVTLNGIFNEGWSKNRNALKCISFFWLIQAKKTSFCFKFPRAYRSTSCPRATSAS